MGKRLAAIRPTVVRSAGDHSDDGPTGVLDQSKFRMRSAISLWPTSHSLDPSSEWISFRNYSPTLVSADRR